LQEHNESAKKQLVITMKKNKAPIPSLAAGTILIDSHCHLDMSSYNDDLDELLLRAKAHGVHSIITIGIDEESSFRAVELAKRYPMIKATVGVHPHDVEQIDNGTYERIQNLITKNREHIVAYGEIGLDYAKQYAEPTAQTKLQEVAAKVPLKSLFLETDGPFLAPVPWLGKRNEPSYLPYTAQNVAELKGISIEDVATQTSINVQRLFNYTIDI
jgi:Tat protein secretion system quality control protein TatD with DNase activity